ncbi:MAG TPA: hypothetical protein VKW76_06490 [Candidatus Binatia bacterium]|nr:hypothetical protein [Candidatus Binatia bacterium]
MRRTLVLCALWLTIVTVPAHAKPKGPPVPQCGSQTDGSLVTGTLSVQSKGQRPVVLDQTTGRDTANGATSFTIVVHQGKQLVLQLQQTVAADRSASGTLRFGRGFKGITESSFTTDGTTGVMVIDGKRTRPFEVGAAASTIRFEDGSRLPRLHVRPSVHKALLKIAASAKVGCPAPAAAQHGLATPAPPLVQALIVPDALLIGGQATLPDFSFDCLKCEGACSSEWLACISATVAGPYTAGVAELASLAGTGKPTCFEVSTDCLQACHNGGGACCPVECGTCVEAGATCCGPDANGFVGACGPGGKCANPSLALCCPADAGEPCGVGCCPQGDHCSALNCCPAGTGDYCGRLGCCPGGQQCFVSYNPDTGDVLGRVCCDHQPCGDSTCCPADSVCVGPDQCCKATDVCPDGSCCPGGTCVNGTCCPAGGECGDTCCALPGSCCNGQCCGAGEVCVASRCCPLNQACGATCCPTGSACADPFGGICTPCPDGQDPCPNVSGDPMCCATGTECCADGECCAAPTQCCEVNGVVGCFMGFQCIQ